MGLKKRHRLSDYFESPPAAEPTEGVEDASLVHVAYPSPTYECAVEEGPSEEYPVPEEYEPTIEEDGPTIEEAEPPPEEELPEAVPAKEYEAEIAEEPAEYPLVEEAADEPVPDPVEIIDEEETLHHVDVVPAAEPPAEDSDEENAAEAAEGLVDQPAELVLVCTSCTRMLLIEYDGACPYSSITALTGPDHESSSWLLHTTCLSCLNKHNHKHHHKRNQAWLISSRDSLSNACSAAFTSAMLSEEFMMQTRWFEIAQLVCGKSKPMSIVMDGKGRSVAYVAVNVLREETTDECRIMGLKYAGSMSVEVRRSEIVQPFAPGGFM